MAEVQRLRRGLRPLKDGCPVSVESARHGSPDPAGQFLVRHRAAVLLLPTRLPRAVLAGCLSRSCPLPGAMVLAAAS